ncbi:bacterioferritin-associated ferredoxin [Streptomyces sp. NPDC127108]|uniref:(2Fe-2S)-binding protein n=1 Tax=Streptomyces sp. NPDC127108 TaxID=3345361 RepID=UPI0036407ADB
MDPAREVNRVYVCNCFGVTEEQVKKHAEGGACTPRQIASACKAGTDCGSCVRRIQALLGRGACPRRELVDQGEPAVALVPEAELPKIPGIPGVPVPGRELPEAA